MVFINNKYTTTYFAIINNAKNRTNLVGYTENHHIIPKSLGGTNDKTNLVKLSAREHFICHKLLTKMVTGKSRYKILEAFSYFSNNSNRKLTFTSRQASEIREANSIASSERNKGNQFYKFRKPAATELKELRSKNAANCKWVNNGVEEKFSANHEELVEQLHFSYGRLPKLKQKLTGPRGPHRVVRVTNKVECQHCRTMIDPGNFSRWHGEKCKNKGNT